MFSKKELDLIFTLLTYAIRGKFDFVLGHEAYIIASSILRKIAYLRRVDRETEKFFKKQNSTKS